MIKKQLGRTGLAVTQLGYGAMEIRGPKVWGGREVSEARSEPDEGGRSDIELKKRFPGDNFQVLATMRVDREGRIVEARMGRFTLRPPADREGPEQTSTERVVE